MIFFFQILIFSIFINKIHLRTIVYIKYEFTCPNDYPEYIISSEGTFWPINPNNIAFALSYIFKFNEIPHDIEKPLCISWVNLYSYGFLAFYYVSINEYDITEPNNYYDYYYCKDYVVYGQNNFTVGKLPEYCSRTVIIPTSTPSSNILCLKPRNNIDKFYIDDNKINQKFYKGKTLIYFLNNESDDFNINNIFSINGKEYLDFNLDTVSLEIISIQNKKGKIYNGNEELFEGSFFNSKNIYLTHKKINDEGYLTIITIKTKPRNRQSSVYTCETEAKIYLYVAQKNCTINEASDNFCQKCIDEFGKYENNCYNFNEKFRDLYYDNYSQTFKQCETNNNIFACSICPTGSHLLKSEFYYNICEKCVDWKYTDNENQDECILCEIPHCSNCEKKDICLKCDNNALNGYDNCSICGNKNEWKYEGEFCKTKCSKYFYRDNYNDIHCIQEINECPEEMMHLNLDTGECKSNVDYIDLIRGNYQMKLNKDDLEKEGNNLIEIIENDIELFNETRKNNLKIYGNDFSSFQVGQFTNLSIKTDKYEINCPDLASVSFPLNEHDPDKILYQVLEFKIKKDEDGEIHIRFDKNQISKNPVNDPICENQNITYIKSLDDILPKLDLLNKSKNFEQYVRFFKEGHDIFNVYSPFYNDPCYPISTFNKVDLTLNDRRKDMIKVDIKLCRDGCDFEGVNIENFEIICFCKYSINKERQSMSDGLRALKNYSNFIYFKCFNFGIDKLNNNYFSEILIVLFIINIICIVNSEKKIKVYLKNINRNNMNNNEEDNQEIIYNNVNIPEYFFSFLEKVFNYFLDYYKANFDIYETFFNNQDNYEEFKIFPIKIMIYIDSILLTIFIDTLFMNDEAMHKFYEENGKYNIIYRLPIIFFSDSISWLFCYLLEFLIICKTLIKEISNDFFLFNKIKDESNKFRVKSIFKKFSIFKIRRFFFYLLSLLLNILCWFYISCFFSVFQNTQIHLLLDIIFGIIKNIITLTLSSFLYGIYKCIIDKTENYEKLQMFLKCLLKCLENDWIKCVFDILFGIFIIYISTKIDPFQPIFD